MSKKIVITGGAGFIGSHLVDFLVDQHHQVFSLDDLSGGFKENLNPKAEFFEGESGHGVKMFDGEFDKQLIDWLGKQ